MLAVVANELLVTFPELSTKPTLPMAQICENQCFVIDVKLYKRRQTWHKDNLSAAGYDFPTLPEYKCKCTYNGRFIGTLCCECLSNKSPSSPIFKNTKKEICKCEVNNRWHFDSDWYSHHLENGVCVSQKRTLFNLRNKVFKYQVKRTCLTKVVKLIARYNYAEIPVPDILNNIAKNYL